MAGKNTCAVIIRAYNEEKHIGRLLEGVLQQTLREVEIILVDSGSSDRTLTIVAQYPVQVAHIHPDEFSFGRSLNLGLSLASAEYAVIASAHVYPVYPDWLERLLAPLQDAGIALAYGKQRGSPEALFSEQQIFMRWYPEQSNPHQQHPFCNNANAAIRRRLWQEHPYDETLSGLEDLAWARWAVEQGHALAYVAEAEVIHIHQESPGVVYNRYKREAMAFKRIFPHEHFRFNEFLYLMGSNILSDLWHAARQRALRKHFADILWFRWMQFWGTYQGYRRSGPLTQHLRQKFYYPHAITGAQASQPRNVRPIRYRN
ncbi:MAG: glycosyltransferase family 2 protein [Anaerolineales bacterium]|nr:glycosyltransferase family 2 protein [Anaerolineales bacterium]